MDLKLVKKLQAAGVSADVILSLMLDEESTPAPEKTPEVEQPTEPTAPEAAPEPEKKPEPAAAADPVLKAIQELTGAIYRSNIIRDGTNEEELTPGEKANVILTGILSGKPQGKED